MILDDIVTAKNNSLVPKGRFFDTIFNSGNIKIICELKIQSPSHPEPFTDNYQNVLSDYKKAGVDIISVVTESKYFGGKLEMVSQAKANELIVLRKDFITDASQIAEVHADALLLIARILEPSKLKEFVSICQSVNIEPVVEIHSEQELTLAQQSGTRVIAVNTRDLDKQEIDFYKGLKLLTKIDSSYLKLLFSGISTDEQVKQAERAGAKAVLVGTSVLEADNMIAKITEIGGRSE